MDSFPKSELCLSFLPLLSFWQYKMDMSNTEKMASFSLQNALCIKKSKQTKPSSLSSSSPLLFQLFPSAKL